MNPSDKQRSVDTDRHLTNLPEQNPVVDATSVEVTLTAVTEEVENTPHQIGNYRLLQRIGAGGMGEVWVAEQTHPVKRRVALKLIKSGLGSKEIVARFAAERQALAMMNHPNIARILDAGTTKNEQPYFVMEWINGKPLTQYCDENRLGIEERLRLFIDVCGGVQHAHQKGIIHRDLKPGNIIVGMQDGQPLPKIIDFGLAKALESTQRLTDQSLFTGIGQILGTLRYMSPEQASLDNLDIDTRSDIYALGVILYELLTGSTPLDDSSIKGQAALKVLEIIRDREPVKPCSRLSSCSHELVSAITGQRQTDSVRLRRILIGDLDWIVMKALEKDRTRRYESASGFAADIRRYMSSEPVIARPPSVNYRLRKFVRKNRVGVVATGLVALALVGGLVGTTLGQREAIRQAEFARNETKQKDAALAEEQRQREEAERQRQLAEQQMQRALAAEELAESRLETAERNLAFARKGNEILGSVFADLDPNANYSEISELRNVLGKNLNQAIDQLQKAGVGEPLDVADMQHTLGCSLVGLGEAVQAVEVFQQALETYNTVWGPSHSKTLTCMNNLALSLERAGRLPEAILIWEQVQERLGVDPAADPFLSLTVMNNLADGYLELGQLEKALSLKKETLELTRTTLGPDDPWTLASMNNLAAGYRAMGQLDLALPLLIESLELLTAKLGPDHPNTLSSMNNLAATYRVSGQLDKAVTLHEQTVERRIAILGPDHPDTLISVNNLATAYLDTGQLKLALPLFEETLERRLKKFGSEHPDTLMSMHNLAWAYSASARPEKAIPLWETTLESRLVVLGPEHPETIATMAFLGRGYLENQRVVEALPLLEKAVKLGETTFGSQHPQVLTMINNLAMAYKRTGQFEKSLPLLEQVLEVRTVELGPDHPSTLGSVYNLADGYLAAKQITDVLPLLKKLQSRLGPDHAYTMITINNLAAGHWSANRSDLAIPLFEELLGVQETKFGRHHPDTQFTLANLGINYHEAGRSEESLPLLEEVLESSRTLPELKWVKKQILEVYAKLNRVDAFVALASEELESARTNLSADSPELAAVLVSLGEQYLRLGQTAQAIKLLRESYEIRNQQTPPEWKTFATQSLLGEALLLQAGSPNQDSERDKLSSEAESLLVSGYEGLLDHQESITPQAEPEIIAAIDRLIHLYDSLGKAEELQKYRKLRDAVRKPEK